MGSIKTDFTVTYPKDRTVLAIQDTIDRLGWRVLEMGSDVIVVRGPGMHAMQAFGLPKITLTLKEEGEETHVDVVGLMSDSWWGYKTFLTGVLGQLVNGVSLRIQTDSIAINPTVALGEGQGTSTGRVPAAGHARDRAQQLMDLKELLDRGVLSEEEFAVEKQRILSSD